MTSVLIVEDHAIVRYALITLLERDRHQIVGETADGSNAVALARKHCPEVVILDLGLKKMDGLSVLRSLRTLAPPPRVLVLTAQPADLFARRCLDAGASAFVAKDNDLTAVTFAMDAILKGYSLFPDLSNFRSPLKSEAERLSKLSDQELNVLRLLARGESNNEIADRMLLSAKTISTYKTRIMEKLEVSSLVALFELSRRNAL
ncbi:response regulator transcription factor [Pseudomonas sp. JQ170]|jgi:two-component system response regulator EvgA|uniref:response regulator transcription factor n=1 Tax=unclassified Pseudomonas TaxID=196821 RepID=UPI00264E328A|nr:MULTISPECIES: response regulator transcription factor [unclassified Pseudomonas]MDN7142494.1 response regulator transcription factor [Pseudomonas sp. JQ170]WRO73946.1 response regulator transcription factor [Pseudomonas sp. 170C]